MAQLPRTRTAGPGELTLDEVREVTNMERRIAAILLLESALDETYQAVKANCYDWQG